MYSTQIGWLLPKIAAGALLGSVLLLGGCNSHGAANDGGMTHPGKTAASSPTGRRTSLAEAQKVKANELGQIMVLEYHNIEDRKGQFFQPPQQLRNDLQMLYDNGYVTMDIHDYVSGNITTPAGKTPVVLTFDDASKYQFRYAAGDKIDPNSAVGILDSFAASHPGFGNHATFFVLPEGFSQPDTKIQKYQYLASHGYTLGNHTWTHPIMTHLTPDKVQKELGYDDQDIHKVLPDYTVDVLAYPFGTRPKTNGKDDYTYIASGNYQGHPYHIKEAFLVGSEPAPSPYSIKLKPYAIPRVQAIEADLIRWIKMFKTHPASRFVSDGDPNTISIPKKLAPALNSAAVGDRKVLEL